MYINKRYIPVKSFNFNQWFVYDEIEDVYIDPPVEVLEQIKNRPDVFSEEEYLRTILEDWHPWLEECKYEGDI